MRVFFEDLAQRYLSTEDDQLALEEILQSVETGAVSQAEGWLRGCELIGLSVEPDVFVSDILFKAGEFMPANFESAGRLVILGFALVRKTYRSQREAATHRDTYSGRAEEFLVLASTLLTHQGFEWLYTFVGDVVEALSEEAASLAPVVSVNADLRLPSVYAAYRLYGDASRAGELVEMNASGTAFHMPLDFDALAR